MIKKRSRVAPLQIVDKPIIQIKHYNEMYRQHCIKHFRTDRVLIFS